MNASRSSGPSYAPFRRESRPTRGAVDAVEAAGLDGALAAVAAGAAERDRSPAFPADAFAELERAGATTATIGAVAAGASVRGGWDLVRRVAAADASVGRILDGHLNAVERLEVAAPAAARERELAAVTAGDHLLGVWGADPRPDEGPPARLVGSPDAPLLRGAKTYCSGAGGVAAALVLVGDEDGGPPRLVLVECDERLRIDRDWYRAAGLRASESHRVVFEDAPVVAVLGEPGELSREPWFSRDALRTAASWAGMVDSAAAAAFAELARRREDPFAALAAGRIESCLGTVEAWLDRAAASADGGGELRPTSIAVRAELDRVAKLVLELAAAACGSHPFAVGGALDRARRDLETFLLQHRLEPLLRGLGAARLEAGQA